MSVFSMLAIAGQTTGPNGLIFVEKSQIVKNILLVVYFSSFARVEKCLDSWNKNDAFVNKK